VEQREVELQEPREGAESEEDVGAQSEEPNSGRARHEGEDADGAEEYAAVRDEEAHFFLVGGRGWEDERWLFGEVVVVVQLALETL
jgi:hypothetical protein